MRCNFANHFVYVVHTYLAGAASLHDRDQRDTLRFSSGIQFKRNALYAWVNMLCVSIKVYLAHANLPTLSNKKKEKKNTRESEQFIF